MPHPTLHPAPWRSPSPESGAVLNQKLSQIPASPPRRRRQRLPTHVPSFLLPSLSAADRQTTHETDRHGHTRLPRPQNLHPRPFQSTLQQRPDASALGRAHSLLRTKPAKAGVSGVCALGATEWGHLTMDLGSPYGNGGNQRGRGRGDSARMTKVVRRPWRGAGCRKQTRVASHVSSSARPFDFRHRSALAAVARARTTGAGVHLLRRGLRSQLRSPPPSWVQQPPTQSQEVAHAPAARYPPATHPQLAGHSVSLTAAALPAHPRLRPLRSSGLRHHRPCAHGRRPPPLRQVASRGSRIAATDCPVRQRRRTRTHAASEWRWG